jgi:very-short-patch-repair endonuclease
MTNAERKLWWYLRQLSVQGTHFRRQATIGRYFADFACHERRIVIEIDGGGHGHADQIVIDETRTTYLQSQGYRVLRFWNNEVFENIDGVMAVIMETLRRDSETPHPSDPSPPRATRAGGGEPTHSLHAAGWLNQRAGLSFSQMSLAAAESLTAHALRLSAPTVRPWPVTRASPP